MKNPWPESAQFGLKEKTEAYPLRRARRKISRFRE